MFVFFDFGTHTVPFSAKSPARFRSERTLSFKWSIREETSAGLSSAADSGEALLEFVTIGLAGSFV